MAMLKKMRDSMNKLVVFISSAALVASYAAELSARVEPTAETAIKLEVRLGETVDAYEGTFHVPENRVDPKSRMLTLHYLRFPATGEKEGSPIVYLAGGPGGSGIWMAKNFRFPIFMALREHGDVIALDQRGTGASDDTPECKSSKVIDDTAPLTDKTYFEMQRGALRECIAFWEREGFDLKGYTTPENVADLDALRTHLGAEKITLWGISYGSHLALAALKQMGDRIDRVVVASVEGLDQTVKLPVRTDDYFDRLQQAINTQQAAKAAMPDIKATIRRIHARLDAEPLELQYEARDGTIVNLLWHRRDMQLLASAMIADPGRFANRLVQIYAALESGNTAPLAAMMTRWREPGAPFSFRTMPVMMDIASGIGAERRAVVETQAETALLGPFLNDTLYLLDAAPAYDLGEHFRQKPLSDVPVLLLSGTLDGRTYIESQREAVSGISNLQSVTVKNAGHNLFMVSPAVVTTINEFLRGSNVDGREITIALPEFWLGE